MGRQRDTSGEDGVTIRVLDWCGKYLPPLGLSAETLANETYREMRAMKAILQDDSYEGEPDMVRRPYGANAAVD